MMFGPDLEQPDDVDAADSEFSHAELDDFDAGDPYDMEHNR